jgi:hypothetical protein
MKGWYIDIYGVKRELEQTNRINLGSRQITELIIPNDVKVVCCNGNHLTKLIIPNGVKEVYCNGNNLTELAIPDSVKWVYCWDNNLTELIYPDNCYVKCDPNVKLITRTMYNRSKRLKAILK